MDSDVKPAKRPAKSSRTASLKPKAQTEKDIPKETETFRTPDEVAADQVFEAPADSIEISRDTPQSDKPASSWRQKLKLSWPPGNKEWVATLIIVVVGGFGIFLVLSHHGSKPIVAAQPIKARPKIVTPTTVPSTLSGLPVDPSVNKRPVTGVMIENTTDARPQSGLGQASVVFEAIAEGGVTRFLALYQDTAPANVGPVRSARPYYIQWDLGFDAAYAHVGGSPDALADIKAWGVRDLDQFANGGSYQRIATRAAPHNVYTSISALNQLETAKGYTSSNFTGFLRKKAAPVKVPTAKTINITLSGPVYNAHYDYNAATNSYNRSEGGAPHIDANTNTQISPAVVVVMAMPYSLGALDSSGAYYSQYATIGSGTVYIFQDGTVSTGQWAKTSATSQFTFTDDAGKPIKLNPGQTWLTAVSSASNVTYAP